MLTFELISVIYHYILFDKLGGIVTNLLDNFSQTKIFEFTNTFLPLILWMLVVQIFQKFTKFNISSDESLHYFYLNFEFYMFIREMVRLLRYIKEILVLILRNSFDKIT